MRLLFHLFLLVLVRPTSSAKMMGFVVTSSRGVPRCIASAVTSSTSSSPPSYNNNNNYRPWAIHLSSSATTSVRRNTKRRSPVSALQNWFSTVSSSSPAAPSLDILDPKAPLRPLLAENCRENHLSRYTLPPTRIGVDDYRPNVIKGQRIVAFGDVHGDITALRSFLITARILHPDSTNEDPVWCGGSTICVQTGDVLDRGDDELACFRLLATLARQAVEAGGALLLLYGNHESLNAAGLFQYANPGGNVEFERTIGARIDYNCELFFWMDFDSLFLPDGFFQSFLTSIFLSLSSLSQSPQMVPIDGGCNLQGINLVDGQGMIFFFIACHQILLFSSNCHSSKPLSTFVTSLSFKL